MRILFIKLKEIGDALILTPTLRATRQLYPHAEIWVVVRRGCEGILEGCPDINHLIVISDVKKENRTGRDAFKDLLIFLKLRRPFFDAVFELSDGHRGRLLAVLTRARHRYSVRLSGPLKWWERHRLTTVCGCQWQASHRVEKDFHSVAEVFPLALPIPPMIFARDRMQSWGEAENLSNYCVMQIGSRKEVNRWSREKWREVAAYLLTQFDHIVITCGKETEEVADALWLREQLGPRIICTLGKANWVQVAGLLDKAGLYIGLNTAAMHLAAACQCPIIALFGRTSEEHWYPWRANYRIVAAESFTHIVDARERHQLTRSRNMSGIQPAQVIEACQAMLAETSPKSMADIAAL